MATATRVRPLPLSFVPALPVGPPPILVSTDGSIEAQRALTVAVDIAKRTGAPLHLVHAWTEPMRYLYGAGLYGLPATIEFDYEARAVVTGEAARAAKAGLKPTESVVENGSPGWVVENEAARVHAALIVMGSRGLGTLGRLVGGSVSDEMVQHAPCPVLICRGGRSSWPLTDVFVGDDLSEDAYVAAYAAAVIARAFEVPVHLVHAISPRYAASDTPGSVRRTRDAERAAERALQRRVASLAAATGTEVDFEVTVGDPAAALLEHLRGGGRHGLLAVGRRGRGLVKRAVLGSVSTKVIRAARGPVLVVPPGVGRQ